MSKKIYSFITVVALLISLGFSSIVSNAQEVEETTKVPTEETKNEVTLEEAQKNADKLTEAQKKSFRGQEELSKLIPSLTEELYFNDLADIYDAEKDADEIETLLKNAKEFKEKGKVNVVIATIDSFSGVALEDYAGAFYDVNKLEDSIVIALTKDEIGVFAINSGKSCVQDDFEEKTSKAIETFSDSKKTMKDLINLQTSLIKNYTNIYLKDNKFVIDNEEIFSDEDIKALEKISADYKEKSGIGIAVLTVEKKDSLSEEIYDQYSKEDTWIFIVLSTEEKTLDVLWKKEADEYLTKFIVTRMCEGVESDLQAEEYKNAVSSLEENLIEHLELYGANIENNVGLNRITLKFD